MDKLNLTNVTLIGVDCVDFGRLKKAFDITEAGIDFGASKILSSIRGTDPRWVKVEEINTIESYSKFCIEEMTNYVETEFALVIQHDGFVLNSLAWEDEFLGYDYIGAPWSFDEEFWFTKFNIPERLRGKQVVGNGGFSLRSKRFLDTSRKLAAEGVFSMYQPEDLRLCVFEREYLEAAGLKFAPPDIAKRFSLEHDYEKWTDQFGFHGLEWTDISKWIKENPEWGIKQSLG